MYKNVGETIKSWVTAVTVIVALLFLFVGVSIGRLPGGGESSVISTTILFFVIGLIVGYFFGMLLYAFGELVSHTIKLDEKMSTLLNEKQENLE